eukprot:7045188-Alexandrium_andersonii.AAC.1
MVREGPPCAQGGRPLPGLAGGGSHHVERVHRGPTHPGRPNRKEATSPGIQPRAEVPSQRRLSGVAGLVHLE